MGAVATPLPFVVAVVVADPLKAALAIIGLAEAEVRLPLLRAGEATWKRLADLLDPIMKREAWTAAHPHYALAS